VNRESFMASLDIPFENQLLAFKVCLARRGLQAALAFLNDRTTYRYTALYTVNHGDFRPLHVFDRCDGHRDDLQSALFLDALCSITLADGAFITSDCSQDLRLKPLGGTVVSYCGLVLAPLGGTACGVLCHFDMDHCEVKPCELAFLRAVTPLLLDHAN